MTNKLRMDFLLHGYRVDENEIGPKELTVGVICLTRRSKRGDWKVCSFVAKAQNRRISEAGGDNIWFTSGEVREGSSVQWMWALMDERKKIIRTESLHYREIPRMSVGCKIHASWGIRDTLVEHIGSFVNLETKYKTKYGEQLAVVGEGHCLGDWRVQKGPLADLISKTDWTWRVQVWVDYLSTKEWKWVVVDEQRNLVRWEECSNRTLICSRTGCATMLSPFNYPEIENWSYDFDGSNNCYKQGGQMNVDEKLQKNFGKSDSNLIVPEEEDAVKKTSAKSKL